MAKWIFPCDDHDFARGKVSGIINGGTTYLWHLAHTLQSMGHEAELVANCTNFPECDVIMCQSEWYACPGHIEQFKKHREKGGKLIVILGHFKGGVYFNPNDIEADLFVSTWKGEVVDSFKQEVKFMPHGYCTVCDKEGEDYRGDIVWVGNNYPLRDEDWLNGITLNRVNGIMPDELGKVYRAAKVLPNRHGAFQKGEVSTIPSTLADVPGFACNERLFHITGAGGFQVADDNPQIREFFTEDELVCGTDKKDYQDKIRHYCENPEERLNYIKKGRERVLKEHTYQHRINDLLQWLQ